MKPGDIVLTYLTSKVTINKKWKSSIVGLSTVKNNYKKEGKIIYIDLYHDFELAKTISLQSMKTCEGISGLQKRAIDFNMQRYLISITVDDFYCLMELYPENMELLKKLFIAI